MGEINLSNQEVERWKSPSDGGNLRDWRTKERAGDGQESKKGYVELLGLFEEKNEEEERAVPKKGEGEKHLMLRFSEEKMKITHGGNKRGSDRNTRSYKWRGGDTNEEKEREEVKEECYWEVFFTKEEEKDTDDDDMKTH